MFQYKYSNILHVDSHINGIWNHAANIGDVGTNWFNLKILQRIETGKPSKIIYEILIDDKVVYAIENTQPFIFENVRVEVSGNHFGGDHSSTYPAAKGMYKNFLLKTRKNTGILPKTNFHYLRIWVSDM